MYTFKFKSAAGYTVYAVTKEHLKRLGGGSICDFCGKYTGSGYLVAVLSNYLCKDCYAKWNKESIYYPEDKNIEHGHEWYYDSLFE